MRLFIAIPLAHSTKKKLQGIQQSMPAGIRRQQARQMHITLRFLGEVSSKRIPQLKKRLSNIAASPFLITIEGVGTFPPKGNPSVIWARVDPCKPLLKLQQKVEEVCVEAGFNREKRSFIPHITLGRAGKAANRDIKSWIARHSNQPRAQLTCKQFVLFQSKQKQGEAVHKPLKEYKFDQPAD